MFYFNTEPIYYCNIYVLIKYRLNERLLLSSLRVTVVMIVFMFLSNFDCFASYAPEGLLVYS